jgi:hypothetical protein
MPAFSLNDHAIIHLFHLPPKIQIHHLLNHRQQNRVPGQDHLNDILSYCVVLFNYQSYM